MNTLLFTHLLIGPLMLIFSLYFLKKPPKKPNAYYGYRTKRSQKSQEAWEDANRFSSELMLKVSVLTIIVQIITYLLLNAENSILVSAAVLVAGLIAILPITENRLKEKFGA